MAKAHPGFFSDGKRRYTRSSPDMPAEARRVLGLDNPTGSEAGAAALDAASGVMLGAAEKGQRAMGISGAGVNATESAAALAAEHALDLSTVTGSGAGGKITKADVEAALSQSGG